MKWNLIKPFCICIFRICPSGDWIDCQIPEIVKDGIAKLTDDAKDSDEIDVEALVQAYVNIVAGACIALGKVTLFLFANFIFFKCAYFCCSGIMFVIAMIVNG